MLITGYFSVASRFHIRSLLRIVLETLFYSLAIAAAFLALAPHVIGEKDVVKVFLPITAGEYWFVTSFVALLLVAPALNYLVNGLTAQGRKRMVVLGFVMLSVVPMVTTKPFVFSNFVWFVFLYIAGAHLRLDNQKLQDELRILLDPFVSAHWGGSRPTAAMAAAVLAVACAATSMLVAATYTTNFSVVKWNFFLAANSVPIVYFSCALLVWFSRWNIKHHRVINAIAASTFGVYLIHDNPFVRRVLWQRFAFFYSLSPIELALAIVGASLVVYAVCVVIDYLRILLLERPLFKLLNRTLGARLDAVEAWFIPIQGE